jgi:hypothetical protein
LGLPLYSPEEEKNPPSQLLENSQYSQMRDAEIILRFFALRHVDKYRGGKTGATPSNEVEGAVGVVGPPRDRS